MTLPNLPPEWPELTELDAYKVKQAHGFLRASIHLQEPADRPLYLRGLAQAIAGQYTNADFERGLEETIALLKDAFGERWLELNLS